MKKTFLTLLSVLFCAITFAQSVPQGINYQALARDANGDVLMNQTLMIQFSVISDITTSAVSWQETHTVSTNDYGLYTAIIGQGTATSVGSSATFDVIDWGASNHLLKVEVDFGSGYLDMGTTAFMSVPYAINSTPQNLTISGDTLFISSGNYIILPSSTPSLQIGDFHQGGIIFYLDPSGCHGLVCALTDQSSGIRWFAGSYGDTQAKGDGIYAGKTNTAIIIASQVAIGDDGSIYAARMCNELQITEGGVTYGDWYLPSKDELNEMYLNLHQQGLGGFATNIYWSSTEGDSNYAWIQGFFNGYQSNVSKYYNYNVRAVRAF